MTDLSTLYRLFALPTAQTLWMVFGSCFFALVLGFPLGVGLALWSPSGPCSKKALYSVLDWIVNLFRSFPFVILLIVLFPLTRLIVGTSVGTTATLVPLSIGAAPFVARLVETAFAGVKGGVIEAARSMGATMGQLVWKIWVPESLPDLIRGVTLTAVNLVGYSAMAGAVGGGGLGDVAVRYGVHRYRPDVLLIAVLLIVILVQFIQWAGHCLAQSFEKHRF